MLDYVLIKNLKCLAPRVQKGITYTRKIKESLKWKPMYNNVLFNMYAYFFTPSAFFCFCFPFFHSVGLNIPYSSHVLTLDCKSNKNKYNNCSAIPFMVYWEKKIFFSWFSFYSVWLSCWDGNEFVFLKTLYSQKMIHI